MSSEYKYIAIDLKSFYASVECVDRSLDPLTTHLVVADASRTEKTICLAVTPCLKAEGVSGRARLFEVVSRVREINAERLGNLRAHTNNYSTNKTNTYNTTVIPQKSRLTSEHIIREGDCTGRGLDTYEPFVGNIFSGASVYPSELESNSSLELDYIIAKPRMAKYIDVSTEIYKVYLKYFSPEDIHVYSIDEVFIDVSKYTAMYHSDAKTLATKVVAEVFNATGITATAGIGTNLYLAKIAMDILAKHEEPDENGMRMAALNEDLYKRLLWNHTPITDFWRIGRGIAKRLATCGLYTMGDIARCSLGTPGQKMSEDVLYNLLGKNAELLIDHAWGIEPLRMEDIKSYKPSANSKTTGQVLTRPYTTDECRTIVWEMADELALDLMNSALVTKKLTVTIGYGTKSLEDPYVLEDYIDHMHIDHNGKPIPNHAHSTINLAEQTSLSHDITKAALKLYDKIIDERLLVRKVNITACDVVSESYAKRAKSRGQLALFDTASIDDPNHSARVEHEKNLQNALLHVRAKFGKNAVFKASSLKEEGMQIERNSQIGGHKA